MIYTVVRAVVQRRTHMSKQHTTKREIVIKCISELEDKNKF